MFKSANPFDDIVANATSETLTSENWDLILTICEKVNRSGDSAGRDCVAVIQKRLAHKNANVVLYSLTLCESLAKNCGLKVQREISSRAFTSLLVKILNEKTTHPAVRLRILELIQQWAFEFRSDPSLGIMDETYQQLRAQAKFKFPSPQKPKKELRSEADKRKEEEELQLALALSLSVSEENERRASTRPTTQTEPEPVLVKRVRALYDFEPTESGELGFQKDDVIVVLSKSYQDWWKGELYGRTGIFPVNYVEEIKEGESHHGTGDGDDEAHVLQEAKNVDTLIHTLQGIDPRRDDFSENAALQDMYNGVLGVRPKLVELIKKHGEKKDELTLLSEKLTRARATYEKMMEQSIAKYSNPVINNYPGHIGYPQASVPNPFAQQPGQHASTASAYAPYQAQFSQAPPMQYPQDSQYGAYAPQLQQPPIVQQQPQPPFDQAHSQPQMVQPQAPVDYNAGIPPQPTPQAPMAPYGQQPTQPGQIIQGYQQPPAPVDYSGQSQPVYAPQFQAPMDGQGNYAPNLAPQQSSGFAPPAQYAPTGVPAFQ
ncbi:ESCRT-0 subunit protein hse1 [Lunasporangiospora selenospora]|uniref:Class E vacuolar protein-sorting machinery protein HSE1 n=1 Tax=Lunasporangiospora selenospora TaxID=979761 RepID=A0A9P6FRF6_9FUNG|nr:ESCRT-0 subunit protein hse1 [Lunasporangiospora selenospora]